MKKDLMRKYLQTKLEVENFNTNVNNCTNIINEFNSFLGNVHKQREEFLRNVKGKQRYYDLWQSAEKELKERYPDFDFSMALKIDNLQKDLKDAEYQATHATREESRAYCAGMWNVGFHHDTVPDEYVRKKAENKAAKIRIELHNYKHLKHAKQLYDHTSHLFRMYSSYNKDAIQFENIKDELYKKLLEMHSEAQSAQNVLFGMHDEEIRLAEMVKELPSGRRFTPLKVSKIYMPQTDKRVFTLLHSELSNNGTTKGEPDSMAVSSSPETLIQKMILANLNNAILPKFTYVYDFSWSIGKYCTKMQFNYDKKTSIIVNGEIVYHDLPNKDMWVVKGFDEKGYAIIKKKYLISEATQEKGDKFVAVDLLGNKYGIKNVDSQPVIDSRVRVVTDLLYDKITLDSVDNELFADEMFAKCVQQLLISKYLYSKGLTIENKKYFNDEDRKNIKDILKTIKSKVELSIKRELDKTKN